MKRRLLAAIMAFATFVAASALHADTQTINTVPSNNTTFLSDLQTFLEDEASQRLIGAEPSFVVRGGIHGTGSLTQTFSEVVAYVNGYYVHQAATSHTYDDPGAVPADSEYVFVFLRADDSSLPSVGGLSGTPTADGNLVFVRTLSSANERPESVPKNYVLLFRAQVFAGAVLNIVDMRPMWTPVQSVDDSTTTVDLATELVKQDDAEDTEKVFVVRGWFRLSDDLDTLDNSCIIMLPGAHIYTGGYDLTIDCSFWAPIGHPFGCITVEGASTLDYDDANGGDFWYSGWVSGESANGLLVNQLSIDGHAAGAMGKDILAAADADAVTALLGLGEAAVYDVGTAAGELVALDDSARLPAVDGSQLTGLGAESALPPGTIYGFLLDYDTANGEEVEIGIGKCRDSTDTVNMATSYTITKQIDTAWAAASGITPVGGLDTGAVAAATWYDVYIISNGTDVDAIITASTTNLSNPSGYTYYRRVGSVRTDGAFDVTAFHQQGDYFWWEDPPLDENGSAIAGAGTTFALQYVPPNREVLLICNANVTGDNAESIYHYLYSVNNVDNEVPSLTASPLMFGRNAAASGGTYGGGPRVVWTYSSGSSALIGGRVSANTGDDALLYLTVLGYMDDRGKSGHWAN